MFSGRFVAYYIGTVRGQDEDELAGQRIVVAASRFGPSVLSDSSVGQASLPINLEVPADRWRTGSGLLIESEY